MRALCADRCWVQATLAEHLSVSRHGVNDGENDRYDPGLPLALEVSGVSGLPIEEIFEYEDGTA